MIFDFYHLKKNSINYASHGIRAIKLSFVLIGLGVVGIIHGLLPFIFVDTVSNGIKKIASRLSNF